MAGDIGFGMQVAYSTTENGVYTDVTLVQEVTPPGEEASRPDASYHGQAGYRRRKKPGMIEPGELAFKVLYTKAQLTTLRAIIRSELWWRVKWPLESGESTASTWKSEGFLYHIMPITPMDEPTQIECKVQLSGESQFTAGT